MPGSFRVLPEFDVYQIALCDRFRWRPRGLPVAERSVIQQIADSGRRPRRSGPEARHERRSIAILFLHPHPLIHPQALILLRNVNPLDADIQSEVELSLSFFWRGFALHLADGAVKHLGVELKSDGFDVAALLSAQEIAGTAQLEIERGDLEAAPRSENSFSAASRRRAMGVSSTSAGTRR